MKDLYSSYKEGMWKSTNPAIDDAGITLRLYLIDTAEYTVDLDTHTTLADVPAGARVSSVDLTNVTLIDNGNAVDFDDAVFPGWATTEAEAIIMVQWLGDDTSPLIHYNDEHSGLPITGNTQNVNFAVPAEGYMGL